MAAATTQYTLQDSQIEAVKAAAEAANDTDLVTLCTDALDGSPAPRLQVLAVINTQEIGAFRDRCIAALGGNQSERTAVLTQLSYNS